MCEQQCGQGLHYVDGRSVTDDELRMFLEMRDMNDAIQRSQGIRYCNWPDCFDEATEIGRFALCRTHDAAYERGEEHERSCTVPGCIREQKSRLMCANHYQKALKAGTLEPCRPCGYPTANGKPCSRPAVPERGNCGRHRGAPKGRPRPSLRLVPLPTH